MDYLDPKKKRQHRTQIAIGYALFAIAIGFATLLLVYLTNGYYIDRGTGQVIQNGLVYVDSKPGGAEIFLNGEKQRGATDARLVLPDGTYDIELRREGYRNWSRNLILEGGSLRKLTYPRLIPETLTTTPTGSLRSNPTTALQSIDKRWIALGYSDSPLLIDLIDTESPTPVADTILIPRNIVANQTEGKIEIIDWADDDRTFLAKFTSGETTSYLLIDRENPENSQNLNTIFKNPTFEISFQDRKKDKFFVYQASTQSLFRGDLNSGVSPTPIEIKVQQYKTFGNDWLLYVTESGEEGLVEVRFKRGDKDYLIKYLKTDDDYLLQLAKLGNAPVMGISSPIENRAIIYNDPEDYLNNNPDAKIPVATTVLRVNNPIDLRISTDSSVIMAYGANNFASHEFDADRSYNFKIDIPIDPIQEIRWLDGQHFLFSSNEKQMMMDFDGSNMYELANSMPIIGSFYTNDINKMYSFTAAVAETPETVAVPAQFNLTELLVEADR
jgi:hypothetical protein